MFLRTLIAWVGCFASLSVFAFQCPYTILVTESSPKQNGWSSVKITSAKTLNGWTIYEGSLGDNQFSLAPEEVNENNHLIQTWCLNHKKNYWIQCTYFESSVSMSQVIPKNVKKCNVVIELDKHHNIAKSTNVTCE